MPAASALRAEKVVAERSSKAEEGQADVSFCTTCHYRYSSSRSLFPTLIRVAKRAPAAALEECTNAGAHRLSEATMLYGSSPPPAPRPATPSTHHHAVRRPQRTRMRCERSSR